MSEATHRRALQFHMLNAEPPVQTLTPLGLRNERRGKVARQIIIAVAGFVILMFLLNWMGFLN